MSHAARLVTLAGIALFWSSLAPAQPRFSFDFPAMAHRLVAQLSLVKGERVLIVAHPGEFDALIPHVRYEVMKAGGVDLGVIDVLREPVPEGFDPAVLQAGGQAARVALRGMLKDVDAAIMFPGAVPSQPAYAALQDLLKEKHGRTIHFHWTGNNSAVALPGQPLPSAADIDRLYQQALLDTNYVALADLQRRFEQAMRGREIRVTTPGGTDVRFRIGDRNVTRQDGDASSARTSKGVVLIDREVELPAGAIRVAPIEESVEGIIAFPPSQWDGLPVDDLKLRFSKGKVVEVTASSGKAAAEAEMKRAGEAGRSFREFALGLNPLLAIPERNPWIPYYGYGAGVVRLSLGDNSELGGTVTGGYVRWNFFPDTTVTVGDEVWVRDGRLVMR